MQSIFHFDCMQMIPFCHIKYTLKNKDMPYCLFVYTGGIVLQKKYWSLAFSSPVKSESFVHLKEPALSSKQQGPVPIPESFFCV